MVNKERNTVWQELCATAIKLENKEQLRLAATTYDGTNQTEAAATDVY